MFGNREFRIHLVFSYLVIISLVLFSSGIVFSQQFSDVDLLTPTKIGQVEYQKYGINEKLGNNEFDRFEIKNIIGLYHQRMLGEAMVENNFLNFQFDGKSGQLIKKMVQWRSDLPQQLPPLGIFQKDAETIALSVIYNEYQNRAEILRSSLIIISPQSYVFPIDPTPSNPCWIVRVSDNNQQRILIIDAVSGNFLGYGIAPPTQGYSMSGPQYSNPCSGTWTSWYLTAAYRFNNLGYPATTAEWPERDDLHVAIQNPEYVVFYELAHGGSTSFINGCPDGNNYEMTYASDIQSWISERPPMLFAFIGSCDGMCSTGDGTLSAAFRKGERKNTATVGYCGMSLTKCDTCWSYSVSWQNSLFNSMIQGDTVSYAFNQAMADYPTCDTNECIRFYGDEELIIKNVWVDFGYSGYENGSFDYPYNTMAEGVNAVPVGGRITIKPGTTSETITTGKEFFLTSTGPATIGQ